jgi:hypothetical protein
MGYLWRICHKTVRPTPDRALKSWSTAARCDPEKRCHSGSILTKAMVLIHCIAANGPKDQLANVPVDYFQTNLATR